MRDFRFTSMQGIIQRLNEFVDRLVSNPAFDQLRVGDAAKWENDGGLTATAVVTDAFTMATGASADYVLACDADGVASWAEAADTSPGGSDTHVQFNDGGAFGGSASLVWDGTSLKTNNVVGVSGDLVLADNSDTEGITISSTEVALTSLKLATGASADKVLKSDASGNASWSAVPADGVAGRVQYSDGAYLDSNSGLQYTAGSQKLTVGIGTGDYDYICTPGNVHADYNLVADNDCIVDDDLSVGGNITVGGLVDGRDVSTLGAKLDTSGTMFTQDADAVAITGGTIDLSGANPLDITGTEGSECIDIDRTIDADVTASAIDITDTRSGTVASDGLGVISCRSNITGGVVIQSHYGVRSYIDHDAGLLASSSCVRARFDSASGLSCLAPSLFSGVMGLKGETATDIGQPAGLALSVKTNDTGNDIWGAYTKAVQAGQGRSAYGYQGYGQNTNATSGNAYGVYGYADSTAGLEIGVYGLGYGGGTKSFSFGGSGHIHNTGGSVYIYSSTAIGAVTAKTHIGTSDTGSLYVQKYLEVDDVAFLDGGVVVPTHTPSSASDTGTAGTITWDASYIYVCTATDTWKRAAISTW